MVPHGGKGVFKLIDGTHSPKETQCTSLRKQDTAPTQRKVTIDTIRRTNRVSHICRSSMVHYEVTIHHNARRYVRMNLHSPYLVWLVNINTQFEESGRIVHPVLSISLRQGLSKWNGVNRPICHQNDPFEYRWSNRLKLDEKLANRYKKV